MALSPTSSHGGTSGTSSTKLYDYEVTGSDKASIDSFVDGTTVASFAGYTVLDILLYSRTDEVAVGSAALITVNNDSTALYNQQNIAGVNVTASAAPGIGLAFWSLSTYGASAEASLYGAIAITLPNYLGTVGFKNGTAFTARNGDSTAANNLAAGYALCYRSASAITRLKVASGGGGSPKLKVGTRLLIYGR